MPVLLGSHLMPRSMCSLTAEACACMAAVQQASTLVLLCGAAPSSFGHGRGSLLIAVFATYLS